MPFQIITNEYEFRRSRPFKPISNGLYERLSFKIHTFDLRLEMILLDKSFYSINNEKHQKNQ
jgi:hypothetical protein